MDEVDIVINAIVTFFGGFAVIIGIVALVYGVSVLADRLSCMNVETLTAEEIEQQRLASNVLRDVGLAGLLKEERVKIYRAFVEARSFPYSKPDAAETTPDDAETTPDDPETPQEDKSGKDAKACNCETEDDSDAPTCSICLNEYENGEKVITGTACSHMFHYSCFLQWVDKGNEHCPYCRENMITADNCIETARQALGTERVEKLMMLNEAAALRVTEMMASGNHVSTLVAPSSAAVPAERPSNTEAATPDQSADPEVRTVAAGDVEEPDELPTADNNIEEADLEEGEATEGPPETPNEDIPPQEQPEESEEEASNGSHDAGTDLEVGTTANVVSNKAAPEDIQEC